MIPVKIAHLSDLHCDGKPDWVENYFAPVISLLEREAPEIIVITGDSVNSPRKKQFRTLVESIKYLEERVRTALQKRNNNKLFIVVVPGNHDKFHYGVRFSLLGIKLFGKEKLFHESLCAIYGKGCLKETIRNIRSEYGVSLFPLDSCQGRIDFARGYIKNPLGDFREYNEILKAGNKEGNPSLRIALLHHHPLPVISAPITETKLKNKIRSRYLSLDRAMAFLKAAHETKIDIVLHGHKHINGEYKLEQYVPDTEIWNNLIVSACGSSAKRNEDNRNIKIMELSTSEGLILRNYIFHGDGNLFQLRGDRVVLLSLSEIRRRLFHRDVDSWRVNESPVQEAIRKKKTVTLQDGGDGDGEITIDVDGIKWKKGIESWNKNLKETICAYTGRVKVFKLKAYHKKSSLANWQASIDRAQLSDDFPMHPDGEENIEIKLPEQKYDLNRDIVSGCVIKYLLHNGYALTEKEHRLTNDDWPAQINRSELVSIRADYPVQTLEIDIFFPERSFPDPNRIAFEVYDRSSIKPGQKMILHKRAELIENEINSNNWTIRSWKKEKKINLRIDWPRLDMIYILRWDVPNPHSGEDYTELDKLETELQSVFSRRDSELTDFYNQICTEIKDFFCVTSGTDLLIFLFGRKDNSDKLSVILKPEGIKECSQLLIGRGVEGTAFRTNQAQTFDHERYRKYPLEHVIPDVNPVAMLGLPLSLKIFPKNEERKTLRFTPFSIISIMTESSSSGLRDFKFKDQKEKSDKADPEDIEKITRINSKISGTIKTFIYRKGLWGKVNAFLNGT
ncbi:MAG: metallophosphoesterase [Magnetococcales bacterium]|nr:metallophosphoesterase [Magnetococcales bacterium]